MMAIHPKHQRSQDRYFQGEVENEVKWVPEGIEGRVSCRGALSFCTQQIIGGLQAGMGYWGVRNIQELKQKANFIRITSSGLRVSHVHDLIITQEAPNDRVES